MADVRGGGRSPFLLQRLEREGHLVATSQRSLQVLVTELNDAKRPYACVREMFVKARTS